MARVDVSVVEHLLELLQNIATDPALVDVFCDEGVPQDIPHIHAVIWVFLANPQN